jgi:prevent-host-death family protein
MATLTEIGAYEAKTRLPEFLRKVRAGNCFTITQRGEPIAELIPYGASERQSAAQAAEQMSLFMHNTRPDQVIDIKALIDEGRD